MVVKFDDIYIRLDIRHHHNVTERQKRHNNIALCMLARADVQYKLIAILYQTMDIIKSHTVEELNSISDL